MAAPFAALLSFPGRYVAGGRGSRHGDAFSNCVAERTEDPLRLWY
jgi:hypothetical protein